MSVLSTVPTVSKRQRLIKACFYGYPGVGKTVLCASAPKPIWIDLEDSTESLAYYPEYADIPVLVPKNMNQVEKAVDAFCSDDEFQTLVVDTATRLQFFQVAEHMQGVEGRDQDLPLFQDFRKSTEYLDRIFVKLQKVRKHVIFVCHVKEDTNQEGRVIKIRPDLTPAVGGRLNGLLNVTGYLQIQGGKRTLLLNPTNVIVAKNRMKLTTNLENPTLEKLFPQIITTKEPENNE